eukprot:6208044-Karenia_brevis.AAC.1
MGKFFRHSATQQYVEYKAMCGPLEFPFTDVLVAQHEREYIQPCKLLLPPLDQMAYGALDSMDEDEL